jgi:hypothetical protein
MREIRPSGSEGGGAVTRLSLPLSEHTQESGLHPSLLLLHEPIFLCLRPSRLV